MDEEEQTLTLEQADIKAGPTTIIADHSRRREIGNLAAMLANRIGGCPQPLCSGAAVAASCSWPATNRSWPSSV